MDFTSRADLPELMDADDLPMADYTQCLNDLAAVNRVTFTHRATIGWLERATKTYPPGTHISVLDVASGQGDLLRAIAAWADQRGLKAALAGVDLNPRSAMAAQAATPPGCHINFHTGDVFDFVLPFQPDFIVTSQFTHHLLDAEIIRLLGWMQATAKQGWHITDLHRHPLPYYGFRLLCRLCGWHKIVRYDGTISIARGFTRADWQRYLAAASVTAIIRWHPLFRYGVSRLR